MFNHVLIPLDGSPLAEAAIDAARRIISPHTHITLLTVVQKPSVPVYGYELAVAMSSTYPSKVEEAISDAKTYLHRVADLLRNEGFKVSLIAGFGEDPAQVIVENAQHLGVDAIVMSTHGRSGIKRWLFGSVAERVLCTASCPVFVIPSRMTEQGITESVKEMVN